MVRFERVSYSPLFFIYLFFRPSLKKVSTPPGMGISPTSRTWAAAAARKGSTSGPTSPLLPPANGAASGGMTAGKRGEPLPLGNPQLQSTWEDNEESHAFRVRGPGYLSGGGKVDAGAPFGKLVRADLYKVCIIRMVQRGGDGGGGGYGALAASQF